VHIPGDARPSLVVGTPEHDDLCQFLMALELEK
jgi:hypothetical protein